MLWVWLRKLWACSMLQVGGSEGDREFEERFLECFGLGEGGNSESSQRQPVSRTSSEPTEEERGKLLKEQKINSPW